MHFSRYLSRYDTEEEKHRLYELQDHREFNEAGESEEYEEKPNLHF